MNYNLKTNLTDSVPRVVAVKSPSKVESTLIGSRDPTWAVLLSFLVPGGGQIYTKNYWKAALIAPTEVVLGYLSYREHLKAQKALKQGDTTAYSAYRDKRTAFLWWTFATVVFSMADAYVSAQMFGFDKEMQLSIGPDRLGVIVALK